MTLRDIVAERDPELITFSLGGGIIGCPRDYHYLVEKYPFLAKRHCLGRCDVCWAPPFLCMMTKPRMTTVRSVDAH